MSFWRKKKSNPYVLDVGVAQDRRKPGARDLIAFTPTFVADFVVLPRSADALETAWHAASSALDTEAVRLVFSQADGGVYFIAAKAEDFTSHPDSGTPLVAAIPGMPGHDGDGAYLCDLGGGSTACVIKEGQDLRSFAGEAKDAMQFAGAHRQIWPSQLGKWKGYRELEYAKAMVLAKRIIGFNALFAGVCGGIAIAAAITGAAIKNSNEQGLARIEERQSANLAQVNRMAGAQEKAWAEYVRVTNSVLKLGGQVIDFDWNNGNLRYRAQVPAWVKNLEGLEDAKVEVVGSIILLQKGEFAQ